jgi:Mn-dependent DtxR family transcriptional regulator
MITRQEYERGNFKSREDDVEKHIVTLFLKKHKDKAFTAKELVKYIKMNKYTLRGALKKLREKGLVVHKTPYFIWKNKK